MPKPHGETVEDLVSAQISDILSLVRRVVNGYGRVLESVKEHSFQADLMRERLETVLQADKALEKTLTALVTEMEEDQSGAVRLEQRLDSLGKLLSAESRSLRYRYNVDLVTNVLEEAMPDTLRKALKRVDSSVREKVRQELQASEGHADG